MSPVNCYCPNVLFLTFVSNQIDDTDSKKLGKDYFDYHKSMATSGVFTNSREVHARMELTEGRYCLVPCTFNPNEEGEFLLRMYTEKTTKYVVCECVHVSILYVSAYIYPRWPVVMLTWVMV